MFIDVIRILRGPSAYCPRPSIVVHLHLRDLAGVEPHRVPGLAERLMAAIPGLTAPGDEVGSSARFRRWLREGASLAHVVERVAVALSALSGAPVPHAETRFAGREGRYEVVLAYRIEEVTRHLAQAAVALVEAHVRGGLAAGEKPERTYGDGALTPVPVAVPTLSRPEPASPR